MTNREENVCLAKFANMVKRHDDMVTFMKNVAEHNTELTSEERLLLHEAYKQAVDARRDSWRAVYNTEQKEQGRVPEELMEITREYRKEIENEINNLCSDALCIIEYKIVRNTASGEPKVFYYKMKGDYYRYIAEFAYGSEKIEAAKKCLIAYKVASAIARLELSPAHPTRLGLALNLSVFFHDILHSPSLACRLANAAYNDGATELGTAGVRDENNKAATHILRILQYNYTFWTSEMQEGMQSAEEPSEQIEVRDINEEEDSTGILV
jgi:14-3-3 protein epsilon